MKYDYAIIGAGLFGCVFAHEALMRGKKCLVIDRRDHVGGTCYTKNVNGINVHVYGAHIFNTSNKDVWEYVNRFAEFNRFTNTPIAICGDQAFNMPFNMNTFAKMWGITTPAEARQIIESQRKEIVGEPKNLEEKAISLVGRDLYELLIKGYTEKQWGRPCSDLPKSIIGAVPVRYTYNNSYSNSSYQGVPIGGYTQIFEKLLKGADVMLDSEYESVETWVKATCKNIVFTGRIDQFYKFEFGTLEYRSLRFEHEILPAEDNLQGVAVTNHPDLNVPYTRRIEHKHFCDEGVKGTVITHEYPAAYDGTNDPLYPLNDERNESLYAKYKTLASKESNVFFGGRLGSYKYDNMDKCIASALSLANRIL